MAAPALASRVEVALGLAFWIAAGTTAALAGVFWDYVPFAAPVAALALAWPVVRRKPWALPALDWLPLPFVVLTYEMLHTLVPGCWRTTIDPWLAAADRALLGDHAGVLLEPLVTPALTVAMACSYAAYYVLPVGAAAWWYARRDRVAFRELTAGVVGSLFLGYVGYLYLPAIGPHAWLPASTWTVPLDGDFVSPAIRSLNERHGWAYPRDAFPSLHAANAVTILLVARRRDRRALRVCAVPCLGLICATVYLRFHYVVDVAAGAALAVAWQAAVPRLVARETDGAAPGGAVRVSP